MKLIIAASALVLTLTSGAHAPQCRAEGERCAGADYKPAVAWIECCEGSCSAPHPEWGTMCAKAPVDKKYVEENPKCRAEGERCAGADYKPAVAWIECCEGSCSAPHPEWGMMCAKDMVEKKYVEEKPKCRAKGERCAGAVNKPAVDWIPCCEDGCNAPHPDWGMMCGKAVAVTVAPKPVCVEEKAQCGEGYAKCCGTLECVKDGDKMMCAKPKPKCLAEKTKCGEGYANCCDKLECVKDGDKSMCMMPKPKCLEEKSVCGEGYAKCCDTLECVKDGDKSMCMMPKPKCLEEKTVCGEGYAKCCDTLKCVKNGDKSMCMKPKPKCLQAGSMCGDGYEKCCDKSVCEKEQYGYVKKCVAKY